MARMLISLATAVIVAVVIPQSVAAHPWGEYDDLPYYEEPRFADNSEHTFCFNNLTDKTQNAAQNARDELDASTDMIDNMFCGETTDVQVFDGQYGTVVGWGYGMYECQDPGAGGTCHSANVKINIQPAVMDEQAKRRKTLCHEFGHSVGLRHFGSGGEGHPGCMVSGQPSEANSYTDHERIDHINDRY